MKVYIFKSGNLYLRIDIYNLGTSEIPKVYEISEQDYIKSDETDICKYVKVDIGWDNVIDDHIKYFKDQDKDIPGPPFNPTSIFSKFLNKNLCPEAVYLVKSFLPI